jgi:hypothetical protein
MTDYPALTLETPAEHPFAQFVRILGKGKRGARDLTREEAREAMGMVLDDKVEDTQLGAFLMLLRHKEESAEEMAGFTEALRERLQRPRWRRSGLADLCRQEASPAVVPAGGQVPGAKRRAHLHARRRRTHRRAPVHEQLLASCRSRCAATGSRSATRWTTAAWRSCRWWTGRRSCNDDRPAQHPGPALADPFAGADSQPAARPLWPAKHFPSRLSGGAPRGQRPARRHAIVVKGDGGEIEINPDADSHLYGTKGGESWDEEWPQLSSQRHVKPASWTEHLKAVWRGDVVDSYPQMALISTMALALRGLGKAASRRSKPPAILGCAQQIDLTDHNARSLRFCSNSSE